MFIVMMNGELAENATMNLFSLFGIVTKKNTNSIALLAPACLREKK